MQFLAILESHWLQPWEDVNADDDRMPFEIAQELGVKLVNNPTTRAGLRAESEKVDGQVAKHWSQEPCPFECGMDLDRDVYLSPEESIRYNFWKE